MFGTPSTYTCMYSLFMEPVLQHTCAMCALRITRSPDANVMSCDIVHLLQLRERLRMLMVCDP